MSLKDKIIDTLRKYSGTLASGSISSALHAGGIYNVFYGDQTLSGLMFLGGMVFAYGTVNSSLNVKDTNFRVEKTKKFSK